MKRFVLALVFLSVASQPAWSQQKGRENPIARLDPEAFTDVPRSVRDRLSELGCTVPQAWGHSEPPNVISAHLATPHQTDWATLCSRDGSSEIVILWGGPVTCPDRFIPSPDRDYMSAGGGDGHWFARGIGALPADVLRRWWTPADGRPGIELSQEAIVDSYYEVGGTAYNCHGGEWITLRSRVGVD